MQLLAYLKVKNYEEWRRAFDDDFESRGKAGMTLLQIWRQADDRHKIWMLYEVSERGMADEYLQGLGQLHAEQAGASDGGHFFVETA